MICSYFLPRRKIVAEKIKGSNISNVIICHSSRHDVTDNIPCNRLGTMSYVTNIALINFTQWRIQEVPFESQK